MNYKILHQPNFSTLEIDLLPNETLVTESGAMLAKSKQVVIEPHLSVNPKASNGDKLTKLVIASIRKWIGGESFFVSHFTTPTPGKVWIAPSVLGDIEHYRLENRTFYLTALSYLASMGDFEVKIKWGGLRGLFSKNGLFHLKITGSGDVWFNAFGGIEPIDVDGEYIIDNGHVVAWESSLNYSITRAGEGLTALVASGEGLICKFHGKGRVYIQTRNPSAFADAINTYF